MEVSAAPVYFYGLHPDSGVPEYQTFYSRKMYRDQL